jgi:hypothetical protein
MISVRGTAGALALKGLPIEAAEVCAAARRHSPNFTIAKFRAEAVSDNPATSRSASVCTRDCDWLEYPRAKQDEVRRVCQSNGQSSARATIRPRPGSAVFSNVLLGVRWRVTDVTQYPIPEILP